MTTQEDKFWENRPSCVPFVGMRFFRTDRARRYGGGTGWATYIENDGVNSWVGAPDECAATIRCYVAPEDVRLPGEPGCPKDPKAPAKRPPMGAVWWERYEGKWVRHENTDGFWPDNIALGRTPD